MGDFVLAHQEILKLYLDSQLLLIVIYTGLNKMFRDIDNYSTPREVVAAVTSITEPWNKAGLTPPNLDVIEVARTAQCPIRDVLTAALTESSFELQDIKGGTVNGNLREAAILSAPAKRVARLTQSKGLPYENTAYRLGRRRLKLISRCQ